MEFKELMGVLAENAGADGGFPPDEDGVVRVGYDDLVLAFAEMPEARSLLVWSSLGPLPEKGAEEVKTALLKANFMGRAVNGGALSLSDNGVIYLHQAMPFAFLDAKTFLRMLEDFVGTLAVWAKALSERGRTDSAAPDEEVRPADSGFMRV